MGEKFANAEAILDVIKKAGLDLPLEEHPEALTVEAWEPFHKDFTKVPGSVLTRCLFLKDKKKKLYLLVTLASTKTDMKVFSKAVGAKEPRFGSEDVLLEKLSVVKGAVNPFAIVNDTANEIELCLEKALVESESPLCFHPMDNTKTVITTAAQLQQFFEKNGKTATVVDLSAAPASEDSSSPKPKPKPKAKAKAEKPAPQKQSGNREGVTEEKTLETFAQWYQQVITKAELIEYYDVKGCYILRPNAMSIWKEIQTFLDNEFTKGDIQPCYFPMFVTKNALEREEDHVEGFAAEVAWVTKSGSSDLEVPIAVRPTSETVMYPAFSKWIRSWRDLPLRLNQWCNIVRWEFSHPTPFIRTREFLWQEGHTAHASQEEADKQVRFILDLYARVYEELLAVPVVKGMKTEKEKFAGGDYTTTTEAFIPTVGRSVQGATSHCLGNNFGKMFDIQYEDQNHTKQYPIQTSWGLTTRTIGVLIMIHADNKGLVLPPRVAPTQVIIVPVGINKNKKKEEIDATFDACNNLLAKLKDAGVRVKADLRENVTPGNKFNHWELHGVPLRLEVGTTELEKGCVTAMYRYNGLKKDLPLEGLEATVKNELETIQNGMLERARNERSDVTAMIKAGEFDAIVPELNKKKCCIVPFCGTDECETQIKKTTAEISQRIKEEEGEEGEVDERAPSMGAKTLCIPFDQPNEPVGDKCIRPDCKHPAKAWTLIGRSY